MGRNPGGLRYHAFMTLSARCSGGTAGAGRERWCLLMKIFFVYRPGMMAFLLYTPRDVNHLHRKKVGVV
ncbi:hypothetical protein NDU88_005479 [Pleurodeles waltl]|uniref:Uncharacterized protein n=1 Tax=Pleurodeles waltl TaxID=8319 RepID=A0AAV7MH02_PLEWA|nr:hypothetical protein NDU88_005479 [Pleurodeles waltl]